MHGFVIGEPRHALLARDRMGGWIGQYRDKRLKSLARRADRAKGKERKRRCNEPCRTNGLHAQHLHVAPFSLAFKPLLERESNVFDRMI